MGALQNQEVLDDLGTQDDVLNDPDDFATQFRKSLPEERRAEFDRAFVPKADLTRMRQKDTDRVRTLEERLVRIEQGVQHAQSNGGANGGKDEIQALLDKHGIDADKAGPFRDMMQEFAQSVTRQAVNTTIGQMSPFIQGVTADHHSRQLSQSKQSLINDLGKGVEKLWPDIEEKAREYLNAGRPVDPEMLLKQMYPQEYRRLIAASLEAQRRRDKQRIQSNSMEGLASHTRSAAFPNSGGGDTGAPVVKSLDPNQICADVMKELGWGR